MSRFASPPALAGALLLGACATSPPSSPSVIGLPPAGKDLSQFRDEDASCRAYAAQQIAVITDTGYALQVRYDVAYTQCMYSKGDTVRPLTEVSGYALASYAYVPYPYYGPLFGGAVLGYASGCCRYYPRRFHHAWGGGLHHGWVGPRGNWGGMHPGGWHGAATR